MWDEVVLEERLAGALLEPLRRRPGRGRSRPPRSRTRTSAACPPRRAAASASGAAREAAAPARPRSRGSPSRAGCAGSGPGGSRRGCGSRGRRRRAAPAGSRRSRTSWPEPAIGARASSSGRRVNTRSMSSSTVAVSSDSASWLGSSGEKAGSPASEASTVCICAVTSPRLATRARKASGFVSELLERQLPAAHAVREELLHDAQRGAERAAVVLVPAVERGDVREPARGEEAQQLELRVEPGLQLAEDLHHQLVAEHERRVRLLHADRPHLHVVGELRACRPRA